MRRTGLFVLMTALCLLCACGGRGDEEKLSEMLSDISEAESITTQAIVNSEYGEFTFACESADGKTSVTVISPESISGVCAVASDEGFTLEYDDIALDLGYFGEDSISPVSAVPCVISALCRGWVGTSWREECFGSECIAAEFQISESAKATVWFSVDSGVPIYAELDSGGMVILSSTFESWIRG